ncbi:MAG TPA: formaldehyde-activating enzyme [Acidimicrobiia bacterium]|nr:formaldehyde-activating enzyme [Acidimicrobiia bacterium]
MHIGEGFAGDGVNAAHLNTVLGAKDGPVGTAWATALATPRQGHTPFVVVAAPNLPVKPMTLLVNKATIASDQHARLTWGAAQAGVASGVLDALRKGVIPDVDAERLVLIAAVWVNPDAHDEEQVYENNRSACFNALAAGRDDLPSLRTVLDAGEPENPYFRT